MTVEEGPHRLSLHLSALDTVGLACTALEFTTSSRAEWTSEGLGAWGERLAGRVSYLLEPLKVLEVDRDGGEVQIRSQNPTTRSEQRGYYEVRLSQQGSLRLERFTFDEATRQRRPIACQFTREVLERLADDIAASAA